MSNKSLFVDDDPMLLKGIRRQLDDDYDLGTACGPEEGLELVAEAGPYSVIVSDMRMPNMNGVEFLARVRGIHPNSVRIILTGFADLNSTIKAVNDGNIFRFLGKPVENGDLVAALQAGIRQYELVTAEQSLVEGTLKGAVKVLSEVLGLVNPTAFGQAARVQRVVSALAHDLEIEDAWELEIAAMLYPLGYVTVPDQILEKVAKGRVLTVEERTVYQRHPQAAQRLLRNIPRLETVADIVACQAFSREDFHRNSNTKRVQDGAHILRLALDYDEAEVASGNSDDALEKLRRNADLYEVGMLNSLERLISAHSDHEATEVPVCELQEGMILANDVLDQRGTLLVAKGMR
jgi:ActR/RegA family two-component response regulator